MVSKVLTNWGLFCRLACKRASDKIVLARFNQLILRYLSGAVQACKEFYSLIVKRKNIGVKKI
jgi:hypothetical protein